MPGFIYPNEGSLWLADLVRTGLVATRLGLFQSNTPESPDVVLADLIPADFDGYAPLDPVVWGAVYLDPVTTGGSFQVSKQWNWGPAGTPAVGNTIYGWFLAVATHSKSLCYGRFPGSVSMSRLGNSLPMTLKLNYGANGLITPTVTLG